MKADFVRNPWRFWRPFTWYDSASKDGQKLLTDWGSPRKSPVIEFSDGRRLINPGLREVAQEAAVWSDCPTEPVDLAIIGAGPAGMAAAVYAASEGVSTIVLGRGGPDDFENGVQIRRCLDRSDQSNESTARTIAWAEAGLRRHETGM